MQFLRLAEFHNKNTYKTCRDSWSQKYPATISPYKEPWKLDRDLSISEGPQPKKITMFFCCRIKGMGILWYVYIQRNYVHHRFLSIKLVYVVYFSFQISPYLQKNTPDNSPLATCDDSKFQDIEKQLRDSDKNPVGCIG